MSRLSEREAAVEAVLLMAIRDGYPGGRSVIAGRRARPSPTRAGERPRRRAPRFVARDTDGLRAPLFAPRDTDGLRALRETPLG